ncbi:MAG: phosphatase PAP2 family protein [Rickettsiales bacterium]|jgi:membrane-associated phospholipid phosphatase|nr:phosphatase PAP2 family protein [Rickettsiales bacterium]
MSGLRTLGTIFICWALTTNEVYAGPFTNKGVMGDLFLSASVFYAYGMTAGKEDWAGALQLTSSIVASQLMVEGLKRTVKEERPNGIDNMSFPSGHSAGAFSGAMFVHKRYGWKQAIAPYIMSGIVAWQRVEIRAHYTHDVIAGAAVSALFTWVLVGKHEDKIQVSANSESVRLGFKTEF